MGRKAVMIDWNNNGKIDPEELFLTESILGFSLPRSAYTYNAWWSNGGHTQADAWMNAGYRVTGIDFAGGRRSDIR